MSSSNDTQQSMKLAPDDPVAVIGSSCRFPGGASSPSKLWDLLRNPRDVLKDFEPDRLNLQRFYHRDGETHGSTDVANKSYLLEEDTRFFDASFFSINPAEAAGMDPQQRVLLETVYECFESAGLTLEQLKGSLTSVHVGTMTNDYANIQSRDLETIAKYHATGTANSIVSNRISYVFDLKGPSVTIDTACSSSLVALHHAVRGLQDGDSQMAVVAGVNLIFDAAPYIAESKLHMLSPDSQSRMWDKSANGYARGEGAAALFLKPLSQALRDNDYIEGVIRATGVNSDGQSAGITMPSSPAQAALIHQTYRRAGLDPLKDRPQYFECHGTGTKAGDPVEARAISESFRPFEDNPIYVGSIKTIVGHLEGCAGLAGVMKVLLALKNRTVPPNMLFKELNPAVAPYYGPLQIPTKAMPWPELPRGTPARASINSFGFGGTNAHVILEAFENTALHEQKEITEGQLGPLVFSAASGASLLRNVQNYINYINQKSFVDLRDLSWTLQMRRSTHRFRAHFSGSSRDAVLQAMEIFIANNERRPSAEIGYQPRLINYKETPGILGIFTGQGAQWAQMGKELNAKSPIFRRTLEACEATLTALPSTDTPRWSLIGELMADASTSRIAEAAISQPLCTAVQLGLVNMLKACGISFDAVVGHSSGEIAATYASGIINLQAAMQIAYYRGFHAKLAKGGMGQKGGMLAAGLSLERALQLCSRREYNGRLQVAASNAPQTVTISGDLEAIAEMKQFLDRENIFARQLKVDTAYHSHHMRSCAEPYLQSLLACKIEVHQPKPHQCIWNSSVHGDTRLLRGDLNSLKGPYWVANMVQTVLFSQAIESSIWHGGPFDLAIEVGPHPALKGPVEQTLKALYGSVPLYTGVLSRNGSDLDAFSTAIGSTWAQLGPSFVDFVGYRKAFHEFESPASLVVKDLPGYSWDHDKIYWRESRISKRYRTDRESGHELLGRRTPDDNDSEPRWRNILKLSEMPWLRGHEVLDEVLLPGAAYISIAVEAAKQLASMKSQICELVEVEDVDIQRPVVVPDNRDGVETLFTARVLSSTSDNVLAALFSYYVCNDQSTGTMVSTCSGRLSIHIADVLDDVLPPRDPVPKNLVNINTDRAYDMFKAIGLNYTGLFHGIKQSSRTLQYATATGAWPMDSLSTQYIVHPAILDVAFQTLFIARAHPSSRQITSALLPSHIQRIRVNPTAQPMRASTENGQTEADFDCWVVDQTVSSLTGDLSIYNKVSGKTFLQVEGLTTKMVGQEGASHDRPVFNKLVWASDSSLGLSYPERDAVGDEAGLLIAEAAERMTLYYMNRIVEEISPDERATFQWYHQRMFKAFEKHLKTVANGQHPVLKSEWLNDDALAMEELDRIHPTSIDLKLLHAVGQNMANVVREETQLLEIMSKDDLLNQFYMYNCAARINNDIAKVIKQISFKFPRCRILEIGAGTGGTTWSILNDIDDAYDSYTFTDISSGFFPSATDKFSNFAHKMVFQTLDIEKNPSEQGFRSHSYDIIVAANVLHATRSLETTLKNVRSLLRPGGYLILMEITNAQCLRTTFIFGGFSGWWLSEESHRDLGPVVSAMDWDMVLNDTGFSGADMVIHDLAEESKHLTSLIVSQAINEDYLRIRDPLSYINEIPSLTAPFILIGGKTLFTSKLINEIGKLIPRSWKRQLLRIKSVDEIDMTTLTPGTEVVSLQELDEPLFSTPMTAERMSIIQSLLMSARNLLWVTTAGTAHTPRASMFQGIARIVPSELQHLVVQVIGLETRLGPMSVGRHLVESFLRLKETHDTEYDILWAVEPEFEILADGQVLIPRVVHDKALNQTYNASRRPISKTVNPTSIPIQAVEGPTKIILQSSDSVRDQHRKRVRVKHTLHIPASDGKPLYIVHGTDMDNSSELLTISTVNSTMVDVEPADCVSISDTGLDSGTLGRILTYLQAKAVAFTISKHGSVLLNNPDESLANLVATETSRQGKYIHFMSSNPSAPHTWVKVHMNSSRREIQRLIPHNVQLYIDCSNRINKSSSSISSSLPKDCVHKCMSAEMLRDVLESTESGVEALLREAYSYSTDTSRNYESDVKIDVYSAGELPQADIISLTKTAYVTDWQQQKSLVVSVPPLSLQGIFKPNKTYLMVGAAGGLGLSICEWMVRNGAKNLVITSRNPQVDQYTIKEAQRLGATVKVLAMDVSNIESVKSVVQEAQYSMPPIAGVCNAAMVLSDKMFLDMDVDQLNGTLSAKVYGTEHLDAVFSSTLLDFFIVLSSTATTIGNIGQANYHVANLHMTSLVTQRRARGLTGSVIHIGYVADVGYVTRQDRESQLEQHFRNVRLMALSETDVHHAFAEAVRGGQPGSLNGSPDIIMGLEPPTVPLDLETQTVWLSNPRFGHLVPPSILRMNSGRAGCTSSGSNARRQIEEAQTEDEAVSLLLDAFCTKIESILQLRAGSLKENVQRPIIDLGIDSLIAVEIRNWFLKELGADVPVVKILSGDSILQTCTTAAKKVLGNRAKREQENPVQEEESMAAVSLPAPVLAPVPNVTEETSSVLLPDPIMKRDSSEISDASDDLIFSNQETESSATTGSRSGELNDSESCAGSLKEIDENSGPETVRDERMSPAQARIWFLTKHLDDPCAYNMVFHYRVRGPLKISRLRHALQIVTYHHDSLRTLFYACPDDGVPMQGIMLASAYEMRHISNPKENALEETIAQLKTREWDLENGRTFAVFILSRTSNEHDMIFGYHHIVMDVMGWQFFVRDLDRAYRMEPLDKNPSASYIEYTLQQRNRSITVDEDLRFWKKEFRTVPSPIPLLPIARVNARRTESGSKVSHHEYRELTSTQFAAVKDISKILSISRFHFHLAIFHTLLSKYTNCDDICIGVVDANRNDERFAETVGCFVNMLPVRFHAASNIAMADVAKTLSRKSLAAFAHSSAPLNSILDAVKAPRSPGTTPLFQVAMNYRTSGVWTLPMGECKMDLSLTDGKDAESPYDVTLGIAETGKGCVVEIHSQETLYTRDACHLLLDNYMRLMDQFLSKPDILKADCVIHDDTTVAEALALGKGPSIDYGWPPTLSHRVIETCVLHCTKPAIQFKNTTISYQELLVRVNAVAATLLVNGCTSGSRVAVLCEPSQDAIIAMLAILHIGGVYLPMDVSLPTARHASMLTSSKSNLLLYHSPTEHRVDELVKATEPTIHKLLVDTIQNHSTFETTPCQATPDKEAVLLYTSGSTGTPKGIILSQGNFVNHLSVKTNWLNIGQENVLMQSSMGFDMSLIQTFCALANGGCLIIVPVDIRRDPIQLTNLLVTSHVSLTIATPSEYIAWLSYGSMVLRDNKTWGHACLGGEPVPVQLKNEFRRLDLPQLQLTNCYGPTEITAAATFQRIQLNEEHFDAEISQYGVGKPLPNYSIRILDGAGHPQPIQHVGEICIGGASVALGYLNLPEQTTAKFCTDPGSGERLYRTGDKGSLLPDGTLLCLGRLDGDTQIKHRGLRIELQEVESALLYASQGRLSSVVVSPRGSILVAHATVSSDHDHTSASDLAQILGWLNLPQYSIPAAIIPLSKMPTTTNGKLDREAIAALPLPEQTMAIAATDEATMTIREGELRLLWERVLPEVAKVTRIHPSSDFFLCGGNSMLLMRLQAAIKESMSIEITTSSLYQASTLREMALCIDEQRQKQYNSTESGFDWDTETSLPKWLLSQIQDLPRPAKSIQKSDRIEILMTGATSFLGGHLLKCLVQSPLVSQVHCVGVLADEQDRLYQDSKIKCYTGSLLSTCLGLNPREREQLERLVDVIIHAGSNGHCLNTYGSLRTPNLGSLQFLASMCLSRSVPLLFLSSNRVTLLSGETALPPVSVANFPPSSDGREGYTATKWTGEVFLEKLVNTIQAQARRPWNVSVHRPCVVVSEHAPNSDALNAILRYSALLKCVPYLEGARGYLDFAPVETIVDEMAETAIRMALGNGSKDNDHACIQFQHHSGRVKVPVCEFRLHMESVYGGIFEEVDLREWMRRATQAGIDPLITAYMEGIIEAAAPIVFPYLGEPLEKLSDA